MKIVLDTNVLVSGLISPAGTPGTILKLVAEEHLRLYYDSRILAEYREVLQRPELSIPSYRSARLLDQIVESGEEIQAVALHVPLQDEDDSVFLEVALTAHAACLITGNLKHFPPSCRRGMPVLSPTEFLAFYRDGQAGASGRVKNPAEEYRVCRRAMNKRNKTLTPRRARPRSISRLAHPLAGTLSAEDVNWTPEEVEKVIRSIRRGKSVRKA